MRYLCGGVHVRRRGLASALPGGPSGDGLPRGGPRVALGPWRCSWRGCGGAARPRVELFSGADLCRGPSGHCGEAGRCWAAVAEGLEEPPRVSDAPREGLRDLAKTTTKATAPGLATARPPQGHEETPRTASTDRLRHHDAAT